MAIKQLETNLKVIQSGDVPTTTTLPEGYLSFGKIGGKPKIFGNSEGTIEEYGVSARTATLVVGFTDDCDYNIKNYNGADYTSNAQTVINAAISNLSTGGKITLREGVYNISSSVLMTVVGMILEGVGKNTILIRQNNYAQGVIHATVANCIIQNLCVDGNKLVYTTSTNVGIRLEGYSNGSIVTKCYVINNPRGISVGGWVEQGWCVVSSNICTNNFQGIYIFNTGRHIISNNICKENSVGIYITGTDASFNTVTGNVITNNTSSGMYVNSNSNTISNNIITNNAINGILITLSSSNTVSGNQILNNANSGIIVSSSSNYNLIVGNQFGGNVISDINNTGTATLIRANKNGVTNIES